MSVKQLVLLLVILYPAMASLFYFNYPEDMVLGGAVPISHSTLEEDMKVDITEFTLFDNYISDKSGIANTPIEIDDFLLEETNVLRKEDTENVFRSAESSHKEIQEAAAQVKQKNADISVDFIETQQMNQTQIGYLNENKLSTETPSMSNSSLQDLQLDIFNHTTQDYKVEAPKTIGSSKLEVETSGIIQPVDTSKFEQDSSTEKSAESLQDMTRGKNSEYQNHEVETLDTSENEDNQSEIIEDEEIEDDIFSEATIDVDLETADDYTELEVQETCSYFKPSSVCKEQARCYWSSKSSKCRTRSEFLECSMTQLQSKCTELTNCTWTSKSRSRGKYCIDIAGVEFPKILVRIGSEEMMLEKCSDIISEPLCNYEHCRWNSEKCRTSPQFLACDSTQLKKTCEMSSHCSWTSSSRTKGKFCVDFTEEEGIDDSFWSDGNQTNILNEVTNTTLCSVLKSKSKCKARKGDRPCKWTKNSKSTGTYCQAGTLPFARKILGQKFSQDGLFHSVNLTATFQEPEVGICPDPTLCLDSDVLAQKLSVSRNILWSKTKYDSDRCCSYQQTFKIMFTKLAAMLAGHKEWWVESGTLLDLVRFKGRIAPWRTVASVGIRVSSRSQRLMLFKLFDKFNSESKPYVVRGCTSTRCHTSSSSWKKKLDYFELSSIDFDDGPVIKLIPVYVSREFGYCLRRALPIPWEFILPSVPCDGDSIGIRCPNSPNMYLDMMYTISTWRTSWFPEMKEEDFQHRGWLDKQFCPT